MTVFTCTVLYPHVPSTLQEEPDPPSTLQEVEGGSGYETNVHRM